MRDKGMAFMEMIASIMAEIDNEPHSHVCGDDSCGHIWTHKAADIHSQEENLAMHDCPKCGHEAKRAARGPEAGWMKCHAGTCHPMNKPLPR